MPIPVTVTLADELPPSPVHERLKLLLPVDAIVTSSLPLVALEPVHDPDAEQLVELVDDHVKVTVSLIRTVDAEDEIVTVGEGVDGVEEPPPPPPPQETINKKVKVILSNLFLCIKAPK